MQIAINEQGTKLLIATKSTEEIRILRKEKFYCPQCLEKVMIRAGPKTIPHFAHHRHSNCSSHKGESEYHETGKLILFQWLKQQRLHVQLEAFLPEIKQIPDILVTINNKRIAIEFQCSKIRVSDIIQRNKGYEKLKIIPIWILGEKLLKRINSEQFKVDFFSTHFIHRFAKSTHTSLFYFCPHTKQIQILKNIYFYNQNRVFASLKINKLFSTVFIELFHEKSQFNNSLLTFWLKEKQRFRLYFRSQSNRYQQKWQNWLYEKGLFIENLPPYVYLPISSQFLFKVPLWQWQSELIINFIKPLRIGDIFTFETLENYFKRYMYDEKQFPLFKNSQHPIEEYLQYLIIIQLIGECHDNHFKKKSHVKFYRHIDDAVNGDKRLIDYLKGLL